jgi:hypothetical protein
LCFRSTPVDCDASVGWLQHGHGRLSRKSVVPSR